ncbi:endopeptidase La [Sedimenticola sp.]|uniref:endopeptidase La n=1 Tax=Sedimenticola sp. TaxID=1940285 RepID=UPI003D0F297B
MEYPIRNIPVLPVKNTVLFPFILAPMVINRPMSVAAMEQALTSEDKYIAVFTQKEPGVEKPGWNDLYEIGTLGVIKRMARVNGAFHLEIQGIIRARTLGEREKKPYLNDTLRYVPNLAVVETPEAEALHRAVMDLAAKMLKLIRPEMQAGLNAIIFDVDNSITQIYLLSTIFPLNVEKEIELLSASSSVELFKLMHGILEREVQVLQLHSQISSQAASKMGKEQREYLLRQQMRAIQEELGEERPEQADVNELRKRVGETELPESVCKEVKKELGRLERMSSVSPDYQLTRTYLDFVLELPWYKTTEDVLDLKRAREILDADHFDLKDVKELIVEHLAVMKLNPQAKAPILCFVGPPGVGKTSVGQSIARAMGREFERMSLGGLHDEAELRGHRRTYIGAMPGRILQAVRRAGVRNPLLMLDELDKLGRDFRGDPAAALMEILDPAQNREFHDNYLDMPFDLSGVFFIATANTLENIPEPLLDRMEVLRLAGYSDEEKLQIAQRYLIPRRRQEAGLSEPQMQLPEITVDYMIKRYTREAGVRGLERSIGSLARKVATRVAQGEIDTLTITPGQLPELLGPETFHIERMRQDIHPGVAAGLAWTTAGGEVLYVEAAQLPEGRELMLTGQLGVVMQESAKAAHSYIWSHSGELGIDREILGKSGIHVHVPAGAVPKDGPSAGLTMACAMASLYFGTAARADTAMTGEITLSGLVLPVGGIKEKVLAAYRAGIYRVILPAENAKDLVEVPEHVREKMQFVQVSHIREALSAAIPGLPTKGKE